MIGRWCVAGLALGMWLSGMLARAADLYVAPDGNDAWSGRVAKSDGNGKNGPLASLAAAVEASRKEPAGPRRIVLAAGRYYLEKPLVLDARDTELSIEGAGPGKTFLYGGRRITSWQKDGDRFFAAEVPEAKQGKWDFRALVVNDRLCLRARLPETGRMTHESRFPVRWMSSAGNGWERKPTTEELTTLQYRAGDLGSWLSVRNAEVTVYHMWDESMVGLASCDSNTRTLKFSTSSGHPPGAFGVNTYVVWNVREGMTQPGLWYLDREAGRIVYWPLPGEDMSKATVVAPCMETILELRGSKAKPIRGFTLRALTLSATTTPCKAGGFGAGNYRGAIQMTFGQQVRLSEVEVTNTAGHGICDWSSDELHVENCHLHHLGAGGFRTSNGGGRIEGNRICYVGMLYPSALGLTAGGPHAKYVIRRNEVHHTPYSGITGAGEGMVVEENLLHHCMQELHDGAAIYMFGGKGDILRRNVVRDIVAIGQGYGVSSYYLDEKCRDCVVERNVSIGVQRPVHYHMTLGCSVRDNVFVGDGDITLSFQRSSGVHITGNIIQYGGKFQVADPDAVAEWSGNLLVRSGDAAAALSDTMPVTPRKTRDKPMYADALPMVKPPAFDGKIRGEEWPAGGISLGQLNDQRIARGAPVSAKLCADADCLYVYLTVVSMFPEDRKLGRQWSKDEGVELSVAGARPDGQEVTYVFRSFAQGQPESLTVGGATEAEAKALGEAVKYTAAVEKQVWRCQWQIPFSALRFTPKDRAILPVNLTVFRSEDKQVLQWAGTCGPTWDPKRGGRVIFHTPKSGGK